VSNAHLRLDVRLTPRAGCDAIEGEKLLADGRPVLAARVRALPEDGAANDALIRLIARSCGVPCASVRLVAGATSRLKSLRIDGDPVSLAAALGLGQAPRPERGRGA
jgi:uncharacterized protein